MKDLVAGIIGAQHTSVSSHDSTGISMIKTFITEAPEAHQSPSWEAIFVTEKHDAFKIAVIACWYSMEAEKRWTNDSGSKTRRESVARESKGHGWFHKVLCPTVDRFETVFSNNENPEGTANMRTEARTISIPRV